MASEPSFAFASVFSDPMLLLSTRGEVLAANAAAERWLRAHRPLPGRRLADLVLDDADRVDRLVALWGRTSTFIVGALRWRGPDGTAIPARADGARIEPAEADVPPRILLWCRAKDEDDATGRFLALNERIAALGREISERQRVEAELRAQREWLRVTLASIGDAVVTTDRDGRVTFMNAAAQALTGWDGPEAIGKRITDVMTLVNEVTRKPADDPVTRVLRGGRAVGLANTTILIDRTGGEHPIDDSAAPIGGGDEPMMGVVMVFRDVSERQRLHREITRRVDELAEADRRKDEFLAMLGHELRNPLAALANAVAVQRMPGADATARARAGDVIDRQLAVMGRLVDDLLDVARMQAGTIELQREVVDLRPAVGRAVDAAREMLAARQLVVTVVQSPDPLIVDVDVIRIEQIVANLLGNAAKFTPPGGRVDVTTERDGGDAVVTVRDTGIGIEPELLSSIFDLFVQGRRQLHRPEGGLGIGLTLVRTLVELHGGSVEAASAGPAQGSTFRVALPLVVAAGSPEPPAPAPVAAAGLRILVVDDHEDSAEMLGTLLRSGGHTVEIANDGPTALAVAARFRPRLVLLDIGLPGMNGYAVAAALRRIPGLDPLTIAAITGYGQRTDRDRARQAGCDAHLVKPVAPERLRTLLDELR